MYASPSLKGHLPTLSSALASSRLGILRLDVKDFRGKVEAPTENCKNERPQRKAVSGIDCTTARSEKKGCNFKTRPDFPRASFKVWNFVRGPLLSESSMHTCWPNFLVRPGGFRARQKVGAKTFWFDVLMERKSSRVYSLQILSLIERPTRGRY